MPKNRTTEFIILLGIILYIIINYGVLFFDKKIIYKITQEDGIIEYMGALYFFITSILCFVLFKLSKKGNDFRLIRTKKNIFYLLLGIAFLFAAGEEISWGQRIFNIPVPKAWETINAQEELTIHNLKFFQGDNVHPFLNVIDLTSMNTLFLLFSFGLCFFIPLLNKFSL